MVTTRRKKVLVGVLMVATLGVGWTATAPSASAASDTWVGSGGFDDLWSETFRWLGNSSPGAGDTATFPEDAPGTFVDVDAGEGASLLFTGSNFSFSDAAAPVIPPVHWPAITSSTPGANFISVANVDLGGSAITMSNGGTLEFLQGVDVSDDPLTISGDGRVVFRRDPNSDINALIGDDDIFTSVSDFEIGGSGVSIWGGDLHVTGGSTTVLIESGLGSLVASGGTSELESTWHGPISASGQALVHLNLLGGGGATVTGAATLVVPGGVTLSDDTTALTHPVDGNGTTFCDGNLVGAVNILGGTLELGSDDGDPFGDCAVLGDDVLNIVPSFTMGAGGTLAVDVGGSNPNADQDLLFVEGPVDITGSTLELDASADLAPGTVVTILSNDDVDPVVGTFAGLAEGDVVTSNGRAFVISYEGLTGNDVVLEALPTLSIEGPVQGAEGDLGDSNTLDFTVALTAAQEADVTFDVEVDGVLATEGEDFTDPVSTSFTIPGSEDETEVTVSVPIIGDDLDELDENLEVRLTNVEGVEVAEDDAIGVILDDDASPTISVDDVTVVEGDAGTVEATFTLALSEVSGQAVAGQVGTVGQDASPIDDFAGFAEPFLITPGSLSTEVTVDVIGDEVDEVDETYQLLVQQTTGVEPVGSDFVGLGTIDDDDGPTVSVTDANAVESVDAEFFVNLSATSPQDVSVDYQVVLGTASADDLVVTSGTVTVPAGEVEALLVVDVLQDAVDEPDETFTVVLSDPIDAEVAAAGEVVAAAGTTGNGVITDDDPTPAPSSSTTSTTIAVAAGAVDSGQAVPRTGSDTRAPIQVAVGLLLVGGGLVRLGGKRRRRAA